MSELARSLDLAWVLLAAFLVMFMQAGFAMVETGFTRARNAVHTMAMNFVVYPVGVLGFWLVGYGLMMGGVHEWPTLGAAVTGGHEVGLRLGGHLWGLFGASRFALVTVASEPASLAMFLFSAVFMDTAATIPTGAMAERWKFSAFLLYAAFMSALLYPLYGNWVWGGGFLAALGANLGLGHGHVDFAGATVVHMTGGVTALAGAIVLGPRLGRFRADGTVGAMPGHNLPMAVVGSLILAFGWFGFNAGSTLSAQNPRIALIAVNTLLASSAGAVAALLYVWGLHSRPDLAMACNGLLGGLVSITGACAFVSPAAAVLIGLVAGGLVVRAVVFLERRLRVDDPVGAVAVHGVCGAWGGLAVGLFADGSYGDGWNGVAGPVRGLLFGAPSQLGAQCVGVAVNAGFVFAASYGFFRLLERVMGNRVPAEVELTGLDALEMGTDAYPRG
ncbi:ammonium transporter [Anaeromyxobacter paludicola]|uniref:Ammonium transporter n=1 Tax=Anaeromyxobacter paludicola TaxID=2918171 RepID=A0ABM7XFL9_9BACT|nr:ammonium transporter [Anaeromyxobacter paludicola]BDG10667.1 ammonium transporter [Anaeromyxobacter paludicola]